MGQTVKVESRSEAHAVALVPLACAEHVQEGSCGASNSGPTFIQRSRAFTMFPSRFSSKPQPCQAAACLLFATVAASNNCRVGVCGQDTIRKRETCWKHCTGLLRSAAGLTCCYMYAGRSKSAMLPQESARLYLSCIASIAHLALQYSPGLPDEFILATCTCHRAAWSRVASKWQSGGSAAACTGLAESEPAT